nr:BPK_HP1_G0044130.mRNA.1.CDS.1 [Saccharomyces cerevisiae]
MARQGNFYAVRKGRETGIYNTWNECKNQVDGYGGAIYKKFNSYEQAKSFLGQPNTTSNYGSSTHAEDKLVNLIPLKSEFIEGICHFIIPP